MRTSKIMMAEGSTLRPEIKGSLAALAAFGALDAKPNRALVCTVTIVEVRLCVVVFLILRFACCSRRSI